MALSRTLVQLLMGRQRAGILDGVAKKTRLHIADAVAIALAARRGLPFGDWVSKALASGGAYGGCSVIGASQKLAPASAAFVNSALIHMLDFDDIHDGARLHPTCVTLPAALAAAELAGAGVDAMIDAIAISNELMCRLGAMWSPSGAGPGSDWFLTQLVGYFASCMAASLVLGLSEDEIVSAFGLAYMQAAGGKESGFGVGSNARAIYPAFASMSGVQAALLAHAGMTGPESALDGAAGFFHIYFGAEPGKAGLAMLLDADAWLFRETQIKPWPSCRISHPYVAAAFAIRENLPPSAAIERIEIAVNASAAKLCRPLDARCRPSTLQDAKYSIPFMVAFALARGRADLETLTDDVLADPVALGLAAKVEIAETLPDKAGHPPAEIAVWASGNCIRSPKHTDSVFELSDGQVRDKFRGCLAYVGRAGEEEALWERLLHLKAEPIAYFLRAIAPPPA